MCLLPRFSVVYVAELYRLKHIGSNELPRVCVVSF